MDTENQNTNTNANTNADVHKDTETKAEKFIRLGEYRVNKVMNALAQLEHLSNHNAYEYNEEQVTAMFAILEEKMAAVKSKFAPKQTEKNTFSFGKSE